MVISLNFTASPEFSGAYEAEFKVTAGYALHIEQERKSLLKLQLKSVETGKYADCEEPLREPSIMSPVFDKDFNHGVLSDESPKWIKVISYAPVVEAFVISDGETETL